jgi:hypothetical protein
MTTGELIRKNLGLETIPNARISRALGTPIKILFVWFDSYRSNMPVTAHRIRKFPWVSTMFVGKDLERGKTRALFTPLVDLDTYNGTLTNALVIPVNLSGDRFMRPNQFSKKFESIEKNNDEKSEFFIGSQLLQEFVTLGDLADPGNISSHTMTFRRDRSAKMGGENTQAKLVDIVLSEADGSLTIQFMTKVTPYPEEPDHDYGWADPDDNWRILSNNRLQKYEIQIKVLDFFEWLKTHPEGQPVTRKDVKEMLEVSNVQISSTSPSFNWQGFAYWLTQVDGSIYPQNIKPKFWDEFHGDGTAFLDKHTYGLLRQMGFFLNPISSMLTKKLRDRGYIE